jgi:hypothetical protein
MAIKIENQILINNPTLLVEEEKEQAKQRKQLLALATVLKELEGGLASTRGSIEAAATDTPQAAAQDSENSPFETAMAQMALVMQLLEVKIAEADHSKSQSDEVIAKAEATRAQEVLQEVKQKLQDIADARAKQAVADFWTKLVSWVAAVVVAVISIAFGQVEIAVLALTMTTLATTGAFEKMADGISELLQKAGMSKMAADIVAKVFVLVVVIAVSFAVAPTSAAAEVTDAVDEGTEMTTFSSQEAEEEVAEEVEGAATSESSSAANTGGSLLTKLGKVWKAVNLFNRLSPRTNLVIMNTIQTLSQINVEKIVDDIPPGQMSNEEKERLKTILSIVIMIATIIASVGGGSAITETMAASKVGAGSRLAKLFPIISKFALRVDAKTLTVLENLRRAASFISSATQAAEGIFTIQQGALSAEFAASNADLEVNNILMEMQSASASSSIKYDGSIEQQHASADKNFLEKFAAGEKAFAQLFTVNSPI